MAEKDKEAAPETPEKLPEPMPTIPHAGQPSKCTPENLIRALEYIANYEKLDEVIPTIEGLALHLGVARKTIYNWAADDDANPEFLHIFESCMAKQGKVLLNKGLSGDFNSTISKLMLTKHGYVEQNDLVSNGQTIRIGFDPAFNSKDNDKSPRTTENNSKESKAV